MNYLAVIMLLIFLIRKEIEKVIIALAGSAISAITGDSIVEVGGVFLLLILIHIFDVLPFITFGIQILLLNKSLSSLKRFSLDIFSSLWEELAELSEFVAADAHEVDVEDVINSMTLLPRSLSRQSFINQI